MPLTPETRKEIFNKVKVAMEKCCPPLVNTKNTDTAFEIIGNTPVPYGSRKQIIDGMFFATVVNRKDMVSFHFFPIYMNKKAYESKAPTLLKSLKGKACFNFKKPEQVDEKELAV